MSATGWSTMQKVNDALELIVQYGGVDGAHHKAWVLDQVVRILTECPIVVVEGMDYSYEALGESEWYQTLVAEARDGEDGPDTYDWYCGIAP